MRDIKIFGFADEAATDIDGQIKALKRNGLCGLEIRGVDGENISDITLEKAKEVKAKLDFEGLSVWSIGSPIGKIEITDDFEAHKEKLKRTLEIANALDCKNIRMFSFFMPENEDKLKYSSKVIEMVGEMADIASKSKIYLCHENEKGVYGDTPEYCLELFKAIPLLKGVFDPANFVQCKVNTIEAWEMLKDYIYYMHIKDANKKNIVVPAGEGEGNIRYIANEYIKRGGKVFTMEPHLAIFDGFAALEKQGESIDTSQFTYDSADTAFDTACDTFKRLI